MFTLRHIVIICLSALLLLSGCADLDLSEITPRAPETLTVRVTGPVVNLRAGPGLDFAILGTVQEGDRLPVTGRTASGAWLQVQAAEELRWIYGGLTNIGSAELAELPVALPPLGESVSSSGGQSESAAAELEPPRAAAIVYRAPGTYNRDLHVGLRYEFELVWTDNSELWDWEIVDVQGCYDAMRIVMDEGPAKRGLKRLEIVLSDPYTDGDLLNYVPEHYTRDLSTFFPTVQMDQERLLRNWPDWDAEMLPHPDLAYTRAVCLQPGGPDLQVCNLHPLWGEAGSVYLDGSAAVAAAAGAGIAMLGAGPYDGWLSARYGSYSYLVPLDANVADPAGKGPCMRLSKK